MGCKISDLDKLCDEQEIRNNPTESLDEIITEAYKCEKSINSKMIEINANKIIIKKLTRSSSINNSVQTPIQYDSNQLLIQNKMNNLQKIQISNWNYLPNSNKPVQVVEVDYQSSSDLSIISINQYYIKNEENNRQSQQDFEQ